MEARDSTGFVTFETDEAEMALPLAVDRDLPGLSDAAWSCTEQA